MNLKLNLIQSKTKIQYNYIRDIEREKNEIYRIIISLIFLSYTLKNKIE